MPYCPYTDKGYPDAETRFEHIVPLSLGGVNGFEMAVHGKLILISAQALTLPRLRISS